MNTNIEVLLNKITPQTVEKYSKNNLLFLSQYLDFKLLSINFTLFINEKSINSH